MFKKLLIALVVLIAITVGVNYLAFSPEFDYNVEREMKATPAEIVAAMEDLRSWDQWSPWSHAKDPECVFTYEGEPGSGMTWRWVDGPKLGEGDLTVTRSALDGVDYHMEMIKPMTMAIDGGVKLTPKGEGAVAVWWAKGKNDFPGIGRIMSRVFAGSIRAEYATALEGLDKQALLNRAGGEPGVPGGE